MNGQYVYKALDSTVGNMFRKAGQAPSEYPKEPFSTTQRKEKEAAKGEDKTEAAKEREKTWARAWMSSFVQAGKNYGKHRKQKE